MLDPEVLQYGTFIGCQLIAELGIVLNMLALLKSIKFCPRLAYLYFH